MGGITNKQTAGSVILWNFYWHGFGFTCPLKANKKNSVHPSSTVSETCGIYAKTHWRSGGLSWPKILLFFFLRFVTICVFYICIHFSVDPCYQDNYLAFKCFFNTFFYIAAKCNAKYMNIIYNTINSIINVIVLKDQYKDMPC